MFCQAVPCTCFDKPKAEPKARKRAEPRAPKSPATRPVEAPRTAPDPTPRTSALVDAMRAAATIQSEVTITRPRSEEELLTEDVDMCMALQACESLMSEEEKNRHAAALARVISPEERSAARKRAWKERHGSR